MDKASDKKSSKADKGKLPKGSKKGLVIQIVIGKPKKGAKGGLPPGMPFPSRKGKK